MRYFIVALLVFCLVVGLSCGVKVDPTVTYEGTYRSYVKVLNQWTRTHKVYEPSFDTVLVVTATYESRAFRKAFLGEKIRAESFPPDKAERLIRQSDKELDNTAVFFVSFYTPKFKWNKLDVTDPSWRLWLIDAKGRQVAPLKIERVNNVKYSLTKYYPYYDEWSYYYRVSFPRRTEEGVELQLEKGTVAFLVSGIFGRARLIWEIPGAAIWQPEPQASILRSGSSATAKDEKGLLYPTRDSSRCSE